MIFRGLRRRVNKALKLEKPMNCSVGSMKEVRGDAKLGKKLKLRNLRRSVKNNLYKVYLKLATNLYQILQKG